MEPVDRSSCHVLTDLFGRLLQVLLAFVAIAMLWIKRKLEIPIRPVKVWAMDVCKLSFGAFFLHVTSIILAMVFVSNSSGNYDECGIYFATYMLDTTWGAVLMIVFLRRIDSLAARFGFTDVARCGDYGDPPQMRIWWEQFIAFLIAIALMKVCNVLLLWTFFPDIAAFTTNLFSAFAHHRHLELSVVMLIVPGCCNAVQFWVMDSYLKDQTNLLRILSPRSFHREQQWMQQESSKQVPTAQPSVGQAMKSVSPL